MERSWQRARSKLTKRTTWILKIIWDASCFDYGLREAIEDIVKVGGVHFLGICNGGLLPCLFILGGLIYTRLWRLLPTRLWLPRPKLGSFRTKYCETVFVDALDNLQAVILGFDLAGFTNKNTVPPKAQHALASGLFSRLVQEMDVRFDMTCRHKAVFSCL